MNKRSKKIMQQEVSSTAKDCFLLKCLNIMFYSGRCFIAIHKNFMVFYLENFLKKIKVNCRSQV